MSGKLIVIRPDGTETEESWMKSGTPNWETLKRLVGGYIERIRVRYDGKVRDAYVNEDGLSERLEVNYHAMHILAPPFSASHNTIVGPVVIWLPNPTTRKGPKRIAPDGTVSS